ncbi:LysR family transcriptional regulator [Aureimonas ureilytica]|uniref:LysR family transcriptional regulator n=1 Tax=Aureimonas ureilytica TaxID=401562 RepID=UPI000AC62799|nr:LysR family transcriptional regulator [Aureimonas ureilytica]
MEVFDVSLLVTFLSVVDSGSFAAAAAAVGRTPAAVSMQMKRLEEQVGPPGLFVRNHRRMTLTPRAHHLIPYARDVVESHCALRRATIDARGDRHLRVGAPDEILPLVVPAAIEALAALSTDYHLEFVSDNSTVLRSKYQLSGIDILITAGQGNGGDALRLAPMPLHWVTSSVHRAEVEAELPLAVFEDGCRTRQVALEACKDAGRMHRIVHCGQSLTSLLTAARAGFAVAPVMASSLAPDLRIVTDFESAPRLPSVNLVIDRRKGSRVQDAINIVCDSVATTVKMVSGALH